MHDHAYRIVKYALDEMLAADLAERAADFWTGFVEPLFGLPRREKGAASSAGESHLDLERCAVMGSYTCHHGMCSVLVEIRIALGRHDVPPEPCLHA